MPIAVYYLALDHLPDDDNKDDDKDKDDDDDDHHHFFHTGGFDRYWKARLITAAVFFVLMFLVFVPMNLWKNGVGGRVLCQTIILTASPGQESGQQDVGGLRSSGSRRSPGHARALYAHEDAWRHQQEYGRQEYSHELESG